MLALEYSTQAEADLATLADEISDRSIPKAFAVLDAIDATALRVREFPLLGHPHPFLPDPTTLVARADDWLLVYRVLTDRVFVSRIVHSRRDLRAVEFP